MSEIRTEKNKILFEDHYKKIHEIIDFSNYFENKSRIPFHTITNNPTVSSFANTLYKNHVKFFGNDYAISYTLMDFLLIKKLIRSSSPVKICEIGCDNGILSYHLTETLGKFNTGSSLFLVANSIGNDSSNKYLDSVISSENQPNLSVLVTDYEHTNLQAETFDFVFINGSINFDEPFNVIKEAERITRKDGILFCYANGSPLLESCFKTIFQNRDEYTLYPSETIMLAKCSKNSWNRNEYSLYDEIKKFKTGLADCLKDPKNTDELRNYAIKADNITNKAISLHDIENKILFIEIREILSDYITDTNQEKYDIYINKLLFLINTD